MSANTRILLGIFAFIALTLGTFMWFIATWDPGKEVPVIQIDPAMSEGRSA
ncbi:MAG: hypothetical protein AAF678_12615 [Pseudomonadota bacterium]